MIQGIEKESILPRRYCFNICISDITLILVNPRFQTLRARTSRNGSVFTLNLVFKAANRFAVSDRNSAFNLLGEHDSAQLDPLYNMLNSEMRILLSVSTLICHTPEI